MSNESFITCPKCKNRYDLALFDRKDEIICPLCGYLIVLKRDTEVLVKIGEDVKHKLPFHPELEKSPDLNIRVEKDLIKMGVMELIEKFYAIEELICSYLEDKTEEEKKRIALAVIASSKQIDLAPAVKEYLNRQGRGLPLPVHMGYAVLSEIRERQGLYEEAINLCERAYSEGWSGDWLDRIHRCRKTSFFTKD